jgi:hypothetical protein
VRLWRECAGRVRRKANLSLLLMWRSCDWSPSIGKHLLVNGLDTWVSGMQNVC